MVKTRFKKLNNLTTLITGASSGLGRQTAIEFAKEGSNLIITARSEDKLQELKKDIVNEYGIDVLVVKADLSNQSEVKSIVELGLAEFGKIDILVNNAAIEVMAKFEDLTSDEINGLISTNYTAPVFLIHAVLPSMLSRQKGHIVNIGSMVSRMPTPFQEVYMGTKIGLRGLTESLHFAYKNKGVNFSIVEPPGIDGDGIIHRIQNNSKVNLKMPKSFPSVRVEKMAKIVVNAVKKNMSVVSVMPFYMMPRLMVKLMAVFPKMGEIMMKRTGALKFMEKTANYRIENKEFYTENISS